MGSGQHRRAAELRREGYTQAATAEVVGISVRTLRRWEKDGKLDAALTNGSGPEPEPEKESEETGLSEARRRKEIALAKKHELELRRKEGELIERSEHLDVLERAGQAARSAPRRLADEAGELLGTDSRDAMRLLELLVKPVLRVLREPFEGES